MINIRTLLFSLGLLVAGVAGVYLYTNGDRFVTTDNAYLKFEKVTVSSEVSGTISEIRVVENQTVKCGDLLLIVNDAIYKAGRDKAAARLQQAESAVRSLQASYHTKEAQADLDLANIDLLHTRVLAPFDGFVSHIPKLGQHLYPGSPIMSLVSGSDVWIEANFKETDLPNLHVDQAVDIAIDA